MLSQRLAGILLHPTSLPSLGGIGDLGPEAYAFADFLARSGLGLWQVLPLSPPGLLGVVNVRGEIVPLLDTGVLTGTVDGATVQLQYTAATVGLAADLNLWPPTPIAPATAACLGLATAWTSQLAK